MFYHEEREEEEALEGRGRMQTEWYLIEEGSLVVPPRYL